MFFRNFRRLFSTINKEELIQFAPQNHRKLNSEQISVINEIFAARFNEKCQQLLTQKQFQEEELKINVALLDLNSFLQSKISFNSAQRQGQLSTLSALLQETLDSVRDGLNDFRGEVQAASNSTANGTRQQKLEGEIQRREGSLGVALGEFRTRCEAVKLRAIYTFTMGIAGLFLAIVIESGRKRRERKERENLDNKRY